MSVSDALHDWKLLAESAAELKVVQENARELQRVYEEARVEFEQGMDELGEEERETILSIMSIYESQVGGSFSGIASDESLRSRGRQWLVAKIGNEGAEGTSWGEVLDAWATQYPETPVIVLHTVLHQGKDVFTKSGTGRDAVLRLTPQGQSLFSERK